VYAYRDWTAAPLGAPRENKRRVRWSVILIDICKDMCIYIYLYIYVDTYIDGSMHAYACRDWSSARLQEKTKGGSGGV